MDAKQLPVVYPTITGWTWHANLLAMVEQIEEARAWIYNNYLQIFCRMDYRNGGIFLDYVSENNLYLNCPFLEYKLLGRKYVADHWDSFLKFVSDCINEDFYIYGVFNEKWILGRKQDFDHELFIYGYNVENNLLNVADFTFRSKYSFASIDCSMAEKGFEDVTDKEDYLFGHTGGMVLTKIRKEVDLPFNKNMFRLRLYEYLNGINSFAGYPQYDGENFEWYVFGVEIYDYFIKYIQDKEFNNLDLRPFHNFFDHKKLMVKRIEFLMKKHYIEENLLLVQEAEKIEKDINSLWAILLKGILAREKSTVESIKGRAVNLLERTREREIMLYSALLEEI